LKDTFTQKNRTAEGLQESQNRYRAVVEDIPAMICRFKPDGKLSFVNSSFCTFHAKYKDELIGNDFFELFPAEAGKKMQHRLTALTREAPTMVYEHRNVGSDGRVTWQDWTHRALFDESGRVTEYQSIGRDITDQKQAQNEQSRLERQIQQAQKIEAIGTLAGGIAHDFSNILAAVIGHAELALLYLPRKSSAREHIQTILTAAGRARELVGLIRLIRLDEDTAPEPVQVRPVVQGALTVIRSTEPASIEIRENLACESYRVLCDPIRLHQIVINLCTNACQSMRESGGTLTVELAPAEDAGGERADPNLKPGPYVRLTVSDTGRGMDEKMLERIFDPYFSTKQHEVGTGLGLAVVRGVVRTYGGSVQVASLPGRGTDLTVLLPVLTTSL
jgi:PAS domain S-box-containing protein